MKILKLVRLNRRGEERELVLFLDQITEITEVNGEGRITSYDSATGEPNYETERRYVVFLANGERVVLDQANYDTLVSALA